jgi:hypothetical protein
VVNSVIWLWWVIDRPWFEFEFRRFWWFYFYSCSCGQSRLLVSWCVGDSYDMVGSDEDLGRSMILVQRTGDNQAQVRYSVARRSRGWVMPCAVCTVHKEARSAGYLVEPQNQGWRFGDLTLKITATISWFGPQKQAGFGLSVAPQNCQREVGAGHALGSSGLLYLEESRVRVFQSDLKTVGRMTVGRARGIIAEIVWGQSRRRTGRCDRLDRTILSHDHCFRCSRL